MMKQLWCLCRGGPWDGKQIPFRIARGQCTAMLAIGEYAGRYCIEDKAIKPKAVWSAKPTNGIGLST